MNTSLSKDAHWTEVNSCLIFKDSVCLTRSEQIFFSSLILRGPSLEIFTFSIMSLKEIRGKDKSSRKTYVAEENFYAKLAN